MVNLRRFFTKAFFNADSWLLCLNKVWTGWVFVTLLSGPGCPYFITCYFTLLYFYEIDVYNTTLDCLTIKYFGLLFTYEFMRPVVSAVSWSTFSHLDSLVLSSYFPT